MPVSAAGSAGGNAAAQSSGYSPGMTSVKASHRGHGTPSQASRRREPPIPSSYLRRSSGSASPTMNPAGETASPRSPADRPVTTSASPQAWPSVAPSVVGCVMAG